MLHKYLEGKRRERDACTHKGKIRSEREREREKERDEMGLSGEGKLLLLTWHRVCPRQQQQQQQRPGEEFGPTNYATALSCTAVLHTSTLG